MHTLRIRVGLRATAAAALVAVVLALAPAVARADGRAATLQRSVENMMYGPLDMGLSPFVSTRTLYKNGKAAGYGWPAIGALEVFGNIWMIPLNITAGLFRVSAGVAEFPIGLGLLVSKSFTDKEPPVLFDIQRTPALIEYDDPVWPTKLGPYYVEVQGG